MRQGYRKRDKAPFYTFLKAALVLTVLLLLIKPALRYFYPVNFLTEIKTHSEEYGLNAYLVMAVIGTESKFDQNAVSHKNAKGLMQLKDDTAKWIIEEFSIEADGRDIHDADLNIETGCAYLRYLLDKFGSNTRTALAAYNAGEGNVARWLADTEGYELKSIPFAETADYVESVMKRVRIYKFLY